VGLYVMRLALRARAEPFCIFCGYSLQGLPERYRCPECERAYTPEMIADYRRDPEWFRQRWKMQRSLPPQDAPVHVPADAPRRPSREGTCPFLPPPLCGGGLG